MAFTSSILVYVGFIAFAVVFYLNMRDMPVEARTMPVMAIVAVTVIAGILLLSEVVRTLLARGAVSSPGKRGAAVRDQGAQTEDGSRAESHDDARGPTQEALGPEDDFDGLELRRVLTQALPAAILVGVFVFLLPRLGFLFASMGFMAAVAVLLGARSIIKVAAFALLVPVFFLYLFQTLLQVQLP